MALLQQPKTFYEFLFFLIKHTFRMESELGYAMKNTILLLLYTTNFIIICIANNNPYSG